MTKREDAITKHEVHERLADFATVWNELLAAERACIGQLLVEGIDLLESALEVRLRTEVWSVSWPKSGRAKG